MPVSSNRHLILGSSGHQTIAAPFGCLLPVAMPAQEKRDIQPEVAIL
jgi:hypothetical protein